MIDWQYEACKILKLVLQARAPYDTGNLAMDSIRIAGDHSAVYVGGEIADYAVYTNEPWEKGTNPNEGWLQRGIEEALPLIQRALNEKMTKADIAVATKQYRDIYNTRKREFIKNRKERQEKL